MEARSRKYCTTVCREGGNCSQLPRGPGIQSQSSFRTQDSGKNRTGADSQAEGCIATVAQPTQYLRTTLTVPER